MDRNKLFKWRFVGQCVVALRKESVDRNNTQISKVKKGQVALRKESVDRNWALSNADHPHGASLSARRAWIEINSLLTSVVSSAVALRKESVDRNLSFPVVAGSLIMSLSARRAWIEIPVLC